MKAQDTISIISDSIDIVSIRCKGYAIQKCYLHFQGTNQLFICFGIYDHTSSRINMLNDIEKKKARILIERQKKPIKGSLIELLLSQVYNFYEVYAAEYFLERLIFSGPLPFLTGEFIYKDGIFKILKIEEYR